MVAQHVDSAAPLTAWPIVTDLPDFYDLSKPSILDAFSMMLTVVRAGYKCDFVVYQEVAITSSGSVPGRVVLDLCMTKNGYPDQHTIIGGWVVFDGAVATVVDCDTYNTNYVPRIYPPEDSDSDFDSGYDSDSG